MARDISIILAPRSCLGIQSILTDWSAMGLLGDVLWVDAASASSRGAIPCLRIVEGRLEGLYLQSALPDGNALVRLGSLVPLEGESTGDDAESALLHAMQSSTQARVVPIRICLPRPARTGFAPAARYGWHNLLVSPETARGPRRAVVPVSLDDPSERERHEAAAVAGLLGLWVATPESPLDHAQSPTGHGVRLARVEARSWETETADRILATSTLEYGQSFPAARTTSGPITYVSSDTAAAGQMADKVWDAHRASFSSPRKALPSGVRRLGIVDTLKLFWSFLIKGLVNPRAWLSARLDAVKTEAADRVGRVLLGDDSEIEVVWDPKRTPSNMVLQLEAAELSSRLTARLELPPLEPAGTFPDVWNDYAAGALTLGDGLDRGRFEAIRLGAQLGVVRSPASVVPTSEQAFRDVDPALDVDASLRVVHAFDPISQRRLAEQLGSLAGAEHYGSLALKTLRQFEAWVDEVGNNSYAARFGRKLADQLDHHRGEVARLAEEFTALERLDVGQELAGRQRNLARAIRRILGVGVLLAVVVSALAVFSALAAPLLWILLAGIFVSVMVAALAAFVKRQRQLFEALHKRQDLAAHTEVLRENLRIALRDVTRCSEAYEQFLSWNRVLGEFLHRPFGRVASQATSSPLPSDLPGNVVVGQLQYQETDVARVVARLKDHAYPLGWLDLPWRAALASAGERVGPEGHSITSQPKLLLRERAGVPESMLDRWADVVTSDGVGSSGADQLWAKLSSGPKQEALALSEVQGLVLDYSGRLSTTASVLDGVDDPAVRGNDMVGAVLDDQARAQGLNRVGGDPWIRESSNGLHQVVRIEFSEGLETTDLAYQATQEEAHATPPWAMDDVL